MKPQTTLRSSDLKSIFRSLQAANQTHMENFPGDSGARQPVHTVYGGAQLFKAETAIKMGAVALRHLTDYAPDVNQFAAALQLEGDANLVGTIYTRVVEKLQREPVEDFRIDFEDGYGHRRNEEEDAQAALAAREVARGLDEGLLPPFIGIRIKPMNEELKWRAVRTLDIFLGTLLRETKGKLPANFVVTLPKITVPQQVAALVEIFKIIEQQFGLPETALRLELMIETPQSLIDSRGNCALPALLRAAGGRCVAAHFGVYDYTALCNITAAYQAMTHPACDFARHIMQIALAGTGIWLSDGATNIMPVAPHRPRAGQVLSARHLNENRRFVHEAWRINFRDVMHSLRHGYYQGWDLHPAQLPLRYAAVYTYFLESLEAASMRLKNFIEKAAQATLVGEVFDDAATGQALLNYFLRALNCGAITEAEATATGLSIEELQSRSFSKILEGRRRAAPAETRGA